MQVFKTWEENLAIHWVCSQNSQSITERTLTAPHGNQTQNLSYYEVAEIAMRSFFVPKFIDPDNDLVVEIILTMNGRNHQKC